MIKHSTTNSYKSIPHPLVLENSFSFLTYGSFPMGVHFGIRVEMLSFSSFLASKYIYFICQWLWYHWLLSGHSALAA